MSKAHANSSWFALANLYRALGSAVRRDERLVYLKAFLNDLPEDELDAAIHILSGRKIKRICSGNHLKVLCYEAAQLPLWIFNEAIAEGKDVPECLARILPEPTDFPRITIRELLKDIADLPHLTEEDQDRWILMRWQQMNSDSRYLLNRILVSRASFSVDDHELATALAEAKGLDYLSLLKWLSEEEAVGGPLVSRLGELLEETGQNRLPFEEWSVFNYDEFPNLGTAVFGELVFSGIRAQLVVNDGTANLWSESGELLDQKFPEIIDDVLAFSQDMVMEGFLLAFDDRPLAYEFLEKRLKRKRFTPSLARELPVVFMASTLRSVNGEHASFIDGRKILEEMLSRGQKQNTILVSEQVLLEDTGQLKVFHSQLTNRKADSVILRPAAPDSGDISVLWKAPLLSLKLVLLYVDPANWGGREASLSFGIRHGDDYLPFVKTANGLDDADWDELVLWARENTLERFGPVRSVPAEQVFEIGFTRIFEARRKKCGLDVAGARIVKWQKDTSLHLVDCLETALSLV